jgi:hypothetical protein
MTGRGSADLKPASFVSQPLEFTAFRLTPLWPLLTLGSMLQHRKKVTLSGASIP